MNNNTTVMALVSVAILSGGLTFAISGEAGELVNPVEFVFHHHKL